MVKELETVNMNELLKCKITGNASYDPRSAEIIARKY